MNLLENYMHSFHCLWYSAPPYFVTMVSGKYILYTRFKYSFQAIDANESRAMGASALFFF